MQEGIRLLAVDDDEMSLEMLTSILSSLGIQCTKAANGREAIEILASGRDIDILLTDIEMPEMSGIEVVSQCRLNPFLKDLPIVVLASNRDEKIKALKSGADDFLAKPYDLEELEIRISRLIGARQQAQLAKRAKNDFLAVASHELRTPLQTIAGLSGMLDIEGMSIEQQEIISNIKKTNWGLAETIRNIISFVQLDEGATSAVHGEFSLREMVRDAIKLEEELAATHGNNLLLNIVDTVSDTLIGVPFYLHKVLTILIENAIKFSMGGTIHITINEERIDAVQSRIICSVSDCGIGIPAEFLAKVFEPFVQVEGPETRKYGGIGLGLAVAKRMVELMGGTINVQSEPGAGSLFKFTFLSQVEGRLRPDRI